MQRQHVVSLTGLMVAVAGAVAVVALAQADRDPVVAGGPLAPTRPHGWTVTTPVGRTFGDGFESLRLRGRQPAVIDAVRLVGDPRLRLVDVKLVAPDRSNGNEAYWPSWPPSRDRSLAGMYEGATINSGLGATITTDDPAGPGWELLLAIKPVKSGYLVRDGIRIDYTVASKHFSRYLPAQLAVCTARRYQRDGHCPVPKDRS